MSASASSVAGMPGVSSWAPAVFSMELRKILSYRADFWTNFAGGLLAQFGVAWFLWRSIFEHQGWTQVGDFSFPALMLYYVTAPLVLKIVQGHEMGSVSTEIYEGSLTRYLVYPVSFCWFKFTASLAHSFVFAVQFVLITSVCALCFGIPQEFTLSAAGMLRGAVAVAGGLYLYFVIVTMIELAAFWADNVWSLIVCVRFATGLLGGAMIPLSLFPDWAQPVLAGLPFAYFVSFPLRVLLGLADEAEWLHGILVIALWSVVCTLLYRWVWMRGRYRYTGVGI